MVNEKGIGKRETVLRYGKKVRGLRGRSKPVKYRKRGKEGKTVKCYEMEEGRRTDTGRKIVKEKKQEKWKRGNGGKI